METGKAKKAVKTQKVSNTKAIETLAVITPQEVKEVVNSYLLHGNESNLHDLRRWSESDTWVAKHILDEAIVLVDQVRKRHVHLKTSIRPVMRD